MKIAVNDNCSGKFSQMLMDHWRSQGHEVRYELGANPEFGEWADVIYIDWLDNNFLYYYNNKVPKKKLIVRAIDVDLWMGRYKDGGIYEYLDHMIVISPYWHNRIRSEMTIPEGKLHLIPPGVDLNKFTLIDREFGNNVCMVVGNMWEGKNTLEGFRIFQMLCNRDKKVKWKLHIRGEMPGGERELEIKMREQILKNSKYSERVTIYDRVDDMNVWLEPMDYIIVPSLKEAFSYAAGEAMAKGIKPILNNWLGAKDIWNSCYIYEDLNDAVDMIHKNLCSRDRTNYRSFIKRHYSAEQMYSAIDKLLEA